MEYFICSDVHGFYSILKKELKKQGFKETDKNHKLVIIGDAFDRGEEAKELLNYLIKLKKKDKLIYIKGNHESLMEGCLYQLKNYSDLSLGHLHNGTLDTVAQLTGISKYNLMGGVYDYKDIEEAMIPYFELTKDLPYYYEIDDFILTHGYIPTINDYSQLKDILPSQWASAIWLNGMYQWRNGVRLKNKTIICGHWHSSFGHYNYHKIGSGEFEKDSIFKPFIDDQIIAMDACVAFSKSINILRLSTV